MEDLINSIDMKDFEEMVKALQLGEMPSNKARSGFVPPNEAKRIKALGDLN
jgi:hypothetical protein